MELKRYVLTTDGYIYKKKQVKQHKDTNTTHIVSFGIVSYHLINIKKTSDNILDLIEVGDLIEKDNDWEILKVMRISKNGNAVCSVQPSSKPSQPMKPLSESNSPTQKPIQPQSKMAITSDSRCLMMSARDLTYEQGFSDGYEMAIKRYQNIIQELVKMQPAPQYIVVTQERLDEIKKEQLTK